MYVAHAFLSQPPDHARLWRYMTPTAFLSMLLDRSLYFAPLASFEDPFEGVPPPAVIEAMRQQQPPPSDETARRLATWKEMIELCRASVCANCWHLGDEESEAMWKLYGRFEDGLAIVSNPARLRQVFRGHDVVGGLVDYSGREFEAGTTEQSLLQWATTKRPSYRHDNEFRLLVVRRDRGSGDDHNGATAAGVAVPVDPEGLIDEVVLSPWMEPWQIGLFRGLLQRLDFRRPVRESSLRFAPF